MNENSLCAPNTSIIDFAYEEGHPLRLGNYPVSSRSSFWSDRASSDDEALYLSYSLDEINLKAIALFDFKLENDNEVDLKEGQTIWISYRHGQGWLVAENPETGENGLVPEEYVEICAENDEPRRFLPEILQNHDSEWEDIEDEDKGLSEMVQNVSLE